MKTRHIIFSAIVILALSAVVFYNYQFESSSEAIIANNNLQNIQEVEIGMDTSQVLAIMGHPIDMRNYKGELFYDYEMPFGVSFQCQIIFDPSGLVTFISPEPKSLK